MAEGRQTVSIVIPTYGRGEKIRATLDHLLLSDISSLDSVQILIIDDGSPIPVAPIVHQRQGTEKIKIECIRQKNAGPAKARNTGFRASSGEIVLFIDDDILCPPNLIMQHVEAHQENPGCVICGRNPYVMTHPVTPALRYLNSLGYDPYQHSSENYVITNVIASGQLSVERAMFDNLAGVYRDDLATPNAEEFELAIRLQRQRIPILFATRIVAQHNHAVDIDYLCRQAYKHAKGIAELHITDPLLAEMSPDVTAVVTANRRARLGDSPQLAIKLIAKQVISYTPIRILNEWLARALEALAPNNKLLPLIYHLLLTSSMFMGANSLVSSYKKTKSENSA